MFFIVVKVSFVILLWIEPDLLRLLQYLQLVLLQNLKPLFVVGLGFVFGLCSVLGFCTFDGVVWLLSLTKKSVILDWVGLDDVTGSSAVVRLFVGSCSGM